MCRNKYFIRSILLLLVFSFLLNFLVVPKSNASATLTLGGLALGYKVAEAVYLFALASASVGVTYVTWQEAKKAYDMYEGTSPAPLRYPDWEEKTEEVKRSKADLASEKWFSGWDLEVLPGGGGDPDPDGNRRGILGLLGGIGVMGGFINNFLSMFKSLELEEGSNSIQEDKIGDYVDGYDVSGRVIADTNDPEWWFTRVQLRVNGSDWVNVERYRDYRPGSYEFDITRVVENSRSITVYYKTNRDSQKWSPEKNHTLDHELLGYPQGPTRLDEPEKLFDIDYRPILDSSPNIPQPNLIPIRRLRKEVDENGNGYLVWDDTAEKLVEEIVLNTPVDEVLNPEPYPYTIKKDGKGRIKIIPELDPTTPYPVPFPLPPNTPEPIYPSPTPDNPNPLPIPLPSDYPEPYPWIKPIPDPIYPVPTPDNPNPLPIPLPSDYPEPYPWIKPTPDEPLPEPIPYPDVSPYPPYQPLPEPIPYPEISPYPPYQPSPEPVPSPQIPVETGTMIDYTPWLQIIINWLSKIWNKIPILPDLPEFEPEPEPEPEPETLDEIDFSPLIGIGIGEKFPFSLASDLKKSYNLLLAPAVPPLFEVPLVTEKITIDFSNFERWAVITRNFLSIIFIVALIVVTRRFLL